MKREELIAYDKWLTRRKWGTGEIISPEKAADLYLAEHPLPPAEGAEEILHKYVHTINSDGTSLVTFMGALKAMREFAAQQKPTSSATAEEILQKYMDMSMIICPLHVVPRTVALDAMTEFAALQNKPQPTAEGAEDDDEIILGEPDKLNLQWSGYGVLGNCKQRQQPTSEGAEQEKILTDFAEKMNAAMVNNDPEFEQIVNDHYFDLIEQPTSEGAENIRQLLLGWEHYKRDHFRESEALDVEAILMSEYSQIASRPQPTAEGAGEILCERDDAEDFLQTKDIWNHPRISDRTDKESYEVADLMAEFAQKFATLHAQIADKMVEERWINVKDRLPRKDGKSSIYCLVNSEYDGIVMRPYNEYHKCWDTEDADDYYCDAVGGKITHWMPLPNPPIK